MKLIVGLGNPGKEYAKTRHNIGFMAVDTLAQEWGIELNREKFKGVYGMGTVNGEKVYLLKPLTFMNLSGECVRPFMDYFGIEDAELVIIYDDMDTVAGTIRLRAKGGHGGHNGMKSLIQHLGTNQFARVRMGVSKPTHESVVNYVLGRFRPDEEAAVETSIQHTVAAMTYYLENSFENVMNRFNGQQ
ncbi:MAG: aminoacyl-tRNA hydrolase [Culicoidibacterales bacterium]